VAPREFPQKLHSEDFQMYRKNLLAAIAIIAIFAAAISIHGIVGAVPFGVSKPDSTSAEAILRGREAFGDASIDRPGLRRLITPADLPAPYATTSAENGVHAVARPADAWPQAPAGFEVKLYATGLDQPRKIITAPNGDLFVVESQAGRVSVYRGVKSDGSFAQKEIFATGLSRPFGLAFYPGGADPKYLYVGNTASVVRFLYQNGDLQARGKAETIVPSLPSGAVVTGPGHWTRDVVFSRDNSKMFVAVGSYSNVSDSSGEKRRADILEFNPDGSSEEILASGIRNPVGLAIDPRTGDIWTSVNERDELGDDVPPDYITRVIPGGFYGWPWFYIGPNEDPRHMGERPNLKTKVLVPDVLVQAHSASLCLTFYEATQFPQEFRGSIFAAEHGSWNRAKRTGYKVIFVPAPNGKATGEYDDFLTGFVTKDGRVWGRPVGVTVGSEGSLYVTDDGSDSIWRVTYK
jgi:glucose/arabinose dehydrogenase